MTTSGPLTRPPASRWIWPVLMLLLGAAVPAAAIEFTVVTFNVDSGDRTDPRQVARDIAGIEPAPLWGLQEVDGPEDLAVIAAAIGPHYQAIIGSSGRYNGIPDDNLAIVFDPDALELIEAQELEQFSGSRKPLLARFVLRQSGQKFLFMVNHLQRDRIRVRNRQARELNAWARQQILPVMAVGHFNLDWHLRRRQGNQAFELMVHEGIFRWIQPACLARGDCPATGTACDGDRPCIQTFVFVTGAAKFWRIESDLLFLDDADYCRRATRGHSGHRPVRTVVRIPSGG